MEHPAIKIGGVAAMAAVLVAAVLAGGTPPTLLGIRAEFFLFGLTLAGVALLHHRTFEVAVTGLASIVALKLLAVPEFNLGAHLVHESPS